MPSGGGAVAVARAGKVMVSRDRAWAEGGTTRTGSTTGAVSRGDGLDLAYVFNRRVSDPEHDQITAALNGVLDRNGASW